jgi:hypothetical protein
LPPDILLVTTDKVGESGIALITVSRPDGIGELVNPSSSPQDVNNKQATMSAVQKRIINLMGSGKIWGLDCRAQQ